MEYILFWISKTIAEFLIYITIAIVIACIIYVPEIVRQSRCKHTKGVRETSSCDAICEQCGKNLGFIGEWRKNNKS